MKKFSITLLTLALVFGLIVSTSCAGTYVSGNLGALFVNDSDINEGSDTGEITFDTGFGLTGALGRTLGNGNRVEIELGYRTSDIDKITIDGIGTAEIDGDITTLSLMGNAYYDFAADSDFSPFIGGGVGFANIEADIDDFGSEDDTVFAYQLCLGMSFAVNEKSNIDLQYRFFGTSDPDFDGTDAEYTTHNVMIGLRHTF